MQSSKLGMYVKGAPFVNRSRYTKGVPLLSKMVYKRVRGCTLGWSPPDKTWLSIPRGGGHHIKEPSEGLAIGWTKEVSLSLVILRP